MDRGDVAAGEEVHLVEHEESGNEAEVGGVDRRGTAAGCHLEARGGVLGRLKSLGSTPGNRGGA
jgi:hypothetical protein